MRVIHFSDTHLGFSESSRINPDSKVNQREQDVYDAFNAVIAEALERRPDLVVHAGDLFHTPRPNNRALKTAFGGLKRLTDANIPVVLVAGNHSVPRMATTGSIFEILALLPGVQAAYRGSYEVFEIGEAAIHCVPHIPTEQMLSRALSGASPRRQKRFNLLVTHGAVHHTGADYSLGEFNEVAIAPGLLKHLSGFDYVALGHYHRHQQVAHNAWYSGSTERFSLKEANYPKGFLEIDLVTGKVRHQAMPTREIVVAPEIDCLSQTLETITRRVESTLTALQPASQQIIILKLTAIDPTLWTELQRQRKRIEHELLPDAFEIRWERTFAFPNHSHGATDTSIGSLQMEFAAFMRNARIEGLNRERLRQLGEKFLSDAQSQEAEE